MRPEPRRPAGLRAVPDAIAERLPLAASAFASRGFDGTRIEDIADATSIPKATLYYYFRGKQDVLAYLLTAMLASTGELVKLVATGTGSARDRLGRVVHAQLGSMAEHPQLCQVLLLELGRVGRVPELAAAVDDAFHAPTRQLLAEGLADESLRAVADPDTVAAALFGAVAITGLHDIVANGRLDVEHVATDVLGLVLDGLSARRGGST